MHGKHLNNVFDFDFEFDSGKILWAPLVDSVYISSFGRRKSWLVPAQILIGFFMLFLSQNINEWMGDGGEKPQMVRLTVVFFMLWMLTATQDIALDGWALKMLDRANVGHAATCNVVGQGAGGFVGFILLLLLESKDFANQYIFSEPRSEGLVTLAGFLMFWGCVFLIVTVMVAILKTESSEDEKQLESNPEFGAIRVYKLLWKILKLKSIQKFAAIVLTVGLCYAAADAMTNLKLVEYGIPRDKIALLTVPMLPFNIILPIVLSKYTTGPFPLNVYIRAFPFRLVMTTAIVCFVYVTPTIIKNHTDHDGVGIPLYYYIVLVLMHMMEKLPAFMMYICKFHGIFFMLQLTIIKFSINEFINLSFLYSAILAFVAKISDPLIGSTYVTLLSTLMNFGSVASHTLALWLVDLITWKSCELPSGPILLSNAMEAMNNHCVNQNQTDTCTKEWKGKCHSDIDGFYIEVCINSIYGLFWWFWARKMIDRVQRIPSNDWLILSSRSVNDKKNITTVSSDSKVSICYM